MNFQHSVGCLLMVGVLTIGIAGCTNVVHERGQRDIFDQSRISQIQKGSSTKDNITVLFGTPEGTEFAENGDETWTYTYLLVTRNPMGLTRGSGHQSVLSVTFDTRGIVKSYSVHNADL
jgi:outer membrane protein assembly factor BamE (lipoprotein component of BamABCDE complex)